MTPPIIPPIVVATGEECVFYRDVVDTLRAGPSADARLFDSTGRRLVVQGGGLTVVPDGMAADELAGVLRAWLHYMDALRESTAEWTLALLVRASVSHLGYGYSE